jgi:hypothetical protein
MRRASRVVSEALKAAAVFRAGVWVAELVINQEYRERLLIPDTNVRVPRLATLLGGPLGLMVYHAARRRSDQNYCQAAEL